MVLRFVCLKVGDIVSGLRKQTLSDETVLTYGNKVNMRKITMEWRHVAVDLPQTCKAIVEHFRVTLNCTGV